MINLSNTMKDLSVQMLNEVLEILHQYYIIKYNLYQKWNMYSTISLKIWRKFKWKSEIDVFLNQILHNTMSFVLSLYRQEKIILITRRNKESIVSINKKKRIHTKCRNEKWLSNTESERALLRCKKLLY